MHGPLGEEFEDGGTHVAALAARASAAPPAAYTGSKAETAARIESELEPAARPEAEVGLEAVGGLVLAEVVAKVLAELASGLPPLLMQGAAVSGAEAEATRRWCEWVGHVW
jgi:DNA segregation ATPase FtsK/SpoIIIE-like protein